MRARQLKNRYLDNRFYTLPCPVIAFPASTGNCWKSLGALDGSDGKGRTLRGSSKPLSVPLFGDVEETTDDGAEPLSGLVRQSDLPSIALC